MKNEKNMRVFLYIKYSKYWSKSLENFVEHKDFMYLFKYICILNSFKTFFLDFSVRWKKSFNARIYVF